MTDSAKVRQLRKDVESRMTEYPDIEAAVIDHLGIDDMSPGEMRVLLKLRNAEIRRMYARWQECRGNERRVMGSLIHEELHNVVAIERRLGE